MDRRSFLKSSSVAALCAAGGWSGLAKAFVQSGNDSKDMADSAKGRGIEQRRLGGMDVSAIGLGCLPMVGYYGGKYEKKRHDRTYPQGLRTGGDAV